MVLAAVCALALSVGAGWMWSALDGDDADSVSIGPVSLNDVRPPTIGTNAALGGSALPSAAVTDLGGTPVDTASLVGTPLVVNVWGSTCGPCKRELPDFAEAHRRFGNDVRFVGISYLPASAREEAFARDFGVAYELLYDGNGAFISAAGISAFPVTLFVSPDGTVVEQSGALDAERLAAIIEEQLL